MTSSTSNVDPIQRLIDRFHQKKSKKHLVQDRLISFGQSSGFLSNVTRKQAWTLLVDAPSFDFCIDDEQIQSHQYYDQIRMDVIRTLKRFPPNYSDADRHDLQDELILLITRILIHHDELHYYQGYHDICLTFLLVLGKDACLPIIDAVSMSHLKYFMEPTMNTTREQLSYLMPLVNCINSECAEYLQRGDMGHVIFALPWFITWYSHVLDDLEIILRLYDLFLVSHFLMPIYLAAQMIDYHAEEILALDCEMSSLHHYLSALPAQLDQSTWEEIIRRALYLFDEHPPATLEDLTNQWKSKCAYIETAPNPSVRRRRHVQTTAKKPVNSLTRVAFWGLTVTVGGLAIFLWNQSQYLDSEKLFNLGDLFH